jgi:type I restriction enzyme S subunit
MGARSENWARCRLADCVDLVAGCIFKSERFLAEPRDAVALVKGENVSQGRILWEISKYWPASEYDSLARYHLTVGDVVLAMDRPWLPAGLKWAVIRPTDPRALLVQRCARLRSSSPQLSQDFLRYIIGGPGFEDYIRPITTGVNVPHISGSQILAFSFRMPPLDVQRRIAAILSAYDDLIENCERRIRVLDEMARSLYREWFVHFRYPGHENTPLVDSALGRIPKGWEVRTLGDLVSVITKGTTPTTLGHAFTVEGVPFVKAESITEEGRLREDRLGHIQESTHGLLRRSQLQVDDVLFSIAGVIGRTLQVDGRLVPGNTNQALAIIRADKAKLHVAFLHHTVRSQSFQHHSLGRVVQTAQANVSLGVLSAAPVVLPSQHLQREFGRLADAIGRDGFVLEQQATNLRKTRDLLLPRLLSGQLSVEGGL